MDGELDDYNKQFVSLMQESGWVPADCVRELGVTKGTVSQYRSGHTRPSLTVLRLFSAKTGIPLTLIATEQSSAMRDTPPHLEPWETDILAAMRRISPDVRRVFVGHLVQMADVLGSSQATPQPANQPFRYPVIRSASLSTSDSDEKGLPPDPMSEASPTVANAARTGAIAAVRIVRAASRNQPATAEPSANTPAPVAPSHRPKRQRSEAPTQAPKKQP